MSKALAKFDPTDEMQSIIKSANAHLELAKAHTVNSIETYEFADKDLKTIATDLKFLEALEKEAVGVLKVAVKERTDYFAPAKKSLKLAKDVMRTKLSEYNRRQEAVAAAAQKDADAAAQDLGVAPPKIEVATPIGNTTYRDKWEYEIVDMGLFIEHIAQHYAQNPKLLDMIMANDSVLKAIARTVKKEGKMVPGINIVNKRIAIS